MIRRSFLKSGLAAAAVSATAASVGLADIATADETPSNEFPRIKIGQIGVRHEHASGKMNTLKMLPQYYEIVGIAAESPEWEARHKNDAVYRNVKWMSQEELLAQPGLEAIAVETEMTETIPTALKCAEKRLHLHVDKPVGQDLDQCRALFEICKKKRLIMQPGYMFRTNQAFRLLLHAYRSGWLGELHDIQLDMCRNDTSEGFRKWLASYRGGGMYDFGSHLIDFVAELLGPPETITVFERPDPKDSLSDNTLSVLLYQKAIAEVRVSLRKINGFATRRMAAHGTKGSFVVDPIENWSFDVDPETKKRMLNVTLTLQEDNETYKKGTNRLKLPQYPDRYYGQLEDFAAFIRGRKENPYTFEYELMSQKMILAASGYIPWTKE